MNLSRRRLLQAAVAAPWVITTAGLLMPVRQLWTPARAPLAVDLSAGPDTYLIVGVAISASLNGMVDVAIEARSLERGAPPIETGVVSMVVPDGARFQVGDLITIDGGRPRRGHWLGEHLTGVKVIPPA